MAFSCWLNTDVDASYLYLYQGGYVFDCISLFVFLLVSRIMLKLLVRLPNANTNTKTQWRGMGFFFHFLKHCKIEHFVAFLLISHRLIIIIIILSWSKWKSGWIWKWIHKGSVLHWIMTLVRYYDAADLCLKKYSPSGPLCIPIVYACPRGLAWQIDTLFSVTLDS